MDDELPEKDGTVRMRGARSSRSNWLKPLRNALTEKGVEWPQIA
jgi:hypothetical protein